MKPICQCLRYNTHNLFTIVSRLVVDWCEIRVWPLETVPDMDKSIYNWYNYMYSLCIIFLLSCPTTMAHLTEASNGQRYWPYLDRLDENIVWFAPNYEVDQIQTFLKHVDLILNGFLIFFIRLMTNQASLYHVSAISIPNQTTQCTWGWQFTYTRTVVKNYFILCWCHMVNYAFFILHVLKLHHIFYSIPSFS